MQFSFPTIRINSPFNTASFLEILLATATFVYIGIFVVVSWFGGVIAFVAMLIASIIVLFVGYAIWYIIGEKKATAREAFRLVEFNAENARIEARLAAIRAEQAERAHLTNPIVIPVVVVHPEPEGVVYVRVCVQTILLSKSRLNLF
jgi:hypothetical protein